MPTPNKPTVYPKVLRKHPLGNARLQARLAEAYARNKTRPLVTTDRGEQSTFTARDAALCAAVIREEPLLIGGSSVCRSAGHCAGAALLFAVGTPTRHLHDDLTSAPLKYRRRLYDTFRVDDAVLEHIMHANDAANDMYDQCVVYQDLQYHQPTTAQMRNRRKAVLKVIRDYVGCQVFVP